MSVYNPTSTSFHCPALTISAVSYVVTSAPVTVGTNDYAIFDSDNKLVGRFVEDNGDDEISLTIELVGDQAEPKNGDTCTYDGESYVVTNPQVTRSRGVQKGMTLTLKSVPAAG